MQRLATLLALALVALLLAANPNQLAHAATFTVTKTNDSGAGSLRQAILDANANPGLDTIAFNIAGTGTHTIQPTSALPLITDPVIIVGYTQPGASPNTNGPGLGTNAVLKIELDGSIAEGAFEVHGLWILRASGSTVRGLVINRFKDAGITITGDNATGNLIEGNFIGTDVTGTLDLGNTGGVFFVDASDNIVGGMTAAARNLISGNSLGVVLGADAAGNFVRGNPIGTDASGTSGLGNDQTGVTISNAWNNTIGGTTPGARNVISGNGEGVKIGSNRGAEDNLVQGNFIGTDVSGTTEVAPEI